MFWEVLQPRSIIRPIVRAVNILCVTVLAVLYVFSYYDYLHTVIQQDPIRYSSEKSQYSPYSNGQLGIITVDR